MPKFYHQILVLLATFSGAVHAQQQEAELDVYNQCVEQTIQVAYETQPPFYFFALNRCKIIRGLTNKMHLFYILFL